MIFKYFARLDCKAYIDAGDRWAYWELEDKGIVARGQPLDLEAVLAAEGYWHPPLEEESAWLYERVFLYVRAFLGDHKDHRVIWGELDDFAPDFDEYSFEWIEVGDRPMPTPRYLVEALGLRSWSDACSYLEKQPIPRHWWEDIWSSDPSPREKGRRKFLELVQILGGN